MKKLFTIICFFTAFITNAQWVAGTDVNTLVAESDALGMQAQGTSDGHTYIVFWKVVPAPVNIELRLQILDAEGNQTLGSDGMLVSDQIPMSTFTVTMNTVVDAENNLHIGVTGTGDFSAYAFKIDTNGDHLWGANGLSLGSGVPVTILPLSSGGAIVSWRDSGPAVMQKFDANGNAIWPDAKPIGSNNTTAANLFELSNGDFEVVFHAMLSGVSSNLYAQRYDTGGDPVWTDAIQIADGTTAFNRSYTGVQDGDVVYMNYFSAANNRFDSYLQRINPDGTLPWGINGADFDTTQANFEMTSEPAFSAGSDYIWSISRYTDASQSQAGTYVQKFDKTTGARMFTDAAKEVFAIGSENVNAARIWLKDDSPIFLIESGMDNGVSPTTLNAVYLDENGDFAWPEETRPVATFEANKDDVQFTMPANSQNVAVFAEDKGNGAKIYAQNIVDETASTEDFSKADIFFANPVKEEMRLKSQSSIQSVNIFNVLGQQLFSSNYNGKNEISINTQNWTAGIYFMNVSTVDGSLKGMKLVKQ